MTEADSENRTSKIGKAQTSWSKHRPGKFRIIFKNSDFWLVFG
jgi:hypothetical protein